MTAVPIATHTMLDLLLPLWPSLVLLGVAGLMDATMDTLLHHWRRSWFYDLADGNPFSWWGSASQVWRRRYVDNDPESGFTDIYRFWRGIGLAWVYESVADAWHAAKLLRTVVMAAAIGFAALGLVGIAADALYPPGVIQLLAIACAAFVVERGSFQFWYWVLG